MIAAGRRSANVSAAATPARKITSSRNRRALWLGTMLEAPRPVTAIPSSSSCGFSTGVGAPDIGSTPAWFFGNASVSRMNGSSSSVIESRSMPEAIPPCGGAPIASASSRNPNFARCSSGEMSSSPKTFA